MYKAYEKCIITMITIITGLPCTGGLKCDCVQNTCRLPYLLTHRVMSMGLVLRRVNVIDFTM